MFKRIFKQFFYFVCLAFLAIILKFIFADYDKKAKTILLNQAKAYGIFAQIEKVDLKFPLALKLEQANLIFATKPLPLPLLISSSNLNFNFLPILAGRAKVSGELNLLDGIIKFQASRQLTNQNHLVQIEANNILLATHQILKAFGIEGELNTKIDAKFNANVLTSGTAEAEIKNLNYQGGHSIKGIFIVPKISETKLTALIDANNGVFSVKKISLISNLGTLSGGGKFSLDKKNRFDLIDLNFNLELSDFGREAIGGFLALQAKLPFDTEEKSYSLSISKDALKKIELNLIPQER
jgi:hypothetical protein